MWSENVDDWIELVKNSLDSSDPLFEKEIYVSGVHESKTLLIVDNDTDNNFAIVSVERKKNSKDCTCLTVELIHSIEKLATKIEQDHKQWLKQWA